MSNITPAQAAARIDTVPGLTPAAAAALKSLMPLIPQWDCPCPLSNDVAVEGMGMSRQMVSKHLNTLEEAGYLTTTTAGRERQVTLHSETICQYVLGPEYVNLNVNPASVAASNSTSNLPFYPHQYLHQSDATVTGTNGINKPFQNPFLRIIVNNEYKEYIRISIPSSTLFSFSGLQADLKPLIAQAGLERLKPYGQTHSWSFDFMGLYRLLSPSLAAVHEASKDPLWSGYHYHNPKFTPFKRDFFLMSMALELGCCVEDCFTLPSRLDSSGGNFADFWYEQQQGVLFACMNACYPEGDSGAVMRQIKSTWKPSRGKSLLEYTHIVIRNEVIDLLNNPETAEKCYAAFNMAFRKWACTQSYLNNALTRLPRDRQWLNGIWGPNIKMGIASRDVYCYKPLLTAPMLLMRMLIGMNETANLWQYQDEASFDTAASMLVQAYRWLPYADHLKELVASLSHAAPWLKYFYQNTSWIDYHD